MSSGPPQSSLGGIRFVSKESLDAKKEAVKAALGGGFPEWSCPAGLLVTPSTTWYLDAASAAAWVALALS